MYNDIQIMETFNLSPFEYEKLHRWDRKVLYYYLLMKNYYESESFEKMKRKSERDREFKEKLPELDIPRRR